MSDNHARALELIRSGKWDAAHELVQDYSDELSCLIHAYLHRTEGDLSNASYWYRQAGTKIPENSLEEEMAHLMQLAGKR